MKARGGALLGSPLRWLGVGVTWVGVTWVGVACMGVAWMGVVWMGVAWMGVAGGKCSVIYGAANVRGSLFPTWGVFDAIMKMHLRSMHHGAMVNLMCSAEHTDPPQPKPEATECVPAGEKSCES